MKSKGGSSRRSACPLLAVSLLLFPLLAWAQSAISARSGLVHHSEGEVLLVDATPVQIALSTASQFVHINEGQSLRTGAGRSEVLLAPGVFLRAGEETTVEMVSSDLSDVQVRVLAGSAVVDLMEGSNKSKLTLLYQDVPIRFQKKGLYRLDARPGGPPRLRVFQGQALVSLQGTKYELKAKRSMSLDGTAHVAKFKRSERDSFDQWNRLRARAIVEDDLARQQGARVGYQSAATAVWGVYGPSSGRGSSANSSSRSGSHSAGGGGRTAPPPRSDSGGVRSSPRSRSSR